MKTILVIMPVEARHRALLQESLGAHAADYVLWYTEGEAPTPERVRDASVIIGCPDPELLRYGEKLAWLQLQSAGADQYTAPGVLSPGTVLTTAVGAYGLAVSEHMLALTFSLIRRFGQYGRNQVRHEWRHMGRVSSVEGSVAVVLGLGDIGGSYARKLKALGAYVIGLRQSDRPKADWLDEQYTIDRLDEVLPRADIVGMALPGSDATRHILNGERLGMMKQGAYLINAGRGNAVDPEALKAALREGRLGGAGLDVTEPEPLPPEDELWDLPNVILTPHAAGHLFLPETHNRIIAIAGDNLSRWLRGEPLRNVVPR